MQIKRDKRQLQIVVRIRKRRTLKARKVIKPGNLHPEHLSDQAVSV